MFVFLILSLTLNLATSQTKNEGYTLPENVTHFCNEIIEPRLARSGTQSTFWPGALVPYTTSQNFRPEDHTALQKSINEFHRYTCIRFVPRTNEAIYLKVEMNPELHDACGGAPVCHNPEQPTYISISTKCSNLETFAHELGHALCLRHEQNRPDREKFLDFSACPVSSERQDVQDFDVTNYNLYDYKSQMHYLCGDAHKCLTGIPRYAKVTYCGGIGLSTVDADRLNYFYNCKGCHAHRWYNLETLTEQESSTMINFATGIDSDTEPVYLCRAFAEGGILPGNYYPDKKACFVGGDEGSVLSTDHVQVFGLPGSTNLGGSGYSLMDPNDVSFRESYVRTGRSWAAYSSYVGVALLELDGKKRTVLGVITDGFYDSPCFPTPGGIVSVKEENYKLLGCVL